MARLTPSMELQYLSIMPIRQLFLQLLLILGLGSSAEADVSRVNTCRLIIGQAIIAEALRNFHPGVALLLHVYNDLVFPVRVRCDWLRHSGAATSNFDALARSGLGSSGWGGVFEWLRV